MFRTRTNIPVANYKILSDRLVNKILKKTSILQQYFDLYRMMNEIY